MKKILLTLLLIAFAIPSLTFAIAINPSSGVVNSPLNDLVLITEYGDTPSSAMWFYNVDTGVFIGGYDGLLSNDELVFPVRVIGTLECRNVFFPNFCFFDSNDAPEGNYSGIETSVGDCNSLTYTECLAVAGFVNEALWTMTDNLGLLVAVSTIDSVKSNFATILPALLGFAVTIIILFGAWYLVKGFAHRRG